MNERIKQLAEQASHQSPDGYPVTIPYSNDFAKKFSELIIKECIIALRTEECNFSDLAVEEFTRNRKLIEDYFGVKQ